MRLTWTVSNSPNAIGSVAFSSRKRGEMPGEFSWRPGGFIDVSLVKIMHPDPHFEPFSDDYTWEVVKSAEHLPAGVAKLPLDEKYNLVVTIEAWNARTEEYTLYPFQQRVHFVKQAEIEDYDPGNVPMRRRYNLLLRCIPYERSVKCIELGLPW